MLACRERYFITRQYLAVVPGGVPAAAAGEVAEEVPGVVEVGVLGVATRVTVGVGGGAGA